MRETFILCVLDSLRLDLFQKYLDEQSEGFFLSLSRSGTTFTRATAPAPWSLPSHASILTGLYPREHGALRVDTPMDQELQTTAEVATQQGYATGCFTANAFLHPRYGFDSWDRFEYIPRSRDNQFFNSGDTPNITSDGVMKFVEASQKCLQSENPLQTAGNIFNSRLKSFELPFKTDQGETVVQMAGQWLSSLDCRPAFIVLNLMEPHSPHRYMDMRLSGLWNLLRRTEIQQANHAVYGPHQYFERTPIPDEYLLLLKRLLMSELSYLDNVLSDLWATIEATGRSDEVTLILCSDHGDAFGELGFVNHLAGLVEQIVRTPLVVYRPGDQPDRIDERVSLSWIHGTVSDAMGADSNVSLCEPTTYPQFVGAENTGRVFDLVSNTDKLLERYTVDRTAVYDREEPERKYVKVGDEYRIRLVDKDGFSETDHQSGGADKVTSFESRLQETSTEAINIEKSIRSRLEELGYL